MIQENKKVVALKSIQKQIEEKIKVLETKIFSEYGDKMENSEKKIIFENGTIYKNKND